MLSARAAIRHVTWALRWGTSLHRRTLRTSPPGIRYPKRVPNTAGNSLWGQSPSFSFWLAICWVSLGFAAGSYKTCGHAADQSQSCVCTRPLHKLAFCSLGRREAFFKGVPCVLWGGWRHVPCALCPGFHVPGPGLHVPGPSFHVPGPTFHVQAFISQNIRLIQIGYTTITLFIS